MCLQREPVRVALLATFLVHFAASFSSGQDCSSPEGATPVDPNANVGSSLAVRGDVAAGMPAVSPLSTEAGVRRVGVTGDGRVDIMDAGAVARASVPCQQDQDAAYCNTLGTTVFGPDAANTPFADDIALAAVNGCELDRYVIRVTGDRKQDGTGVGAYTVDFGLYETCPGAGSAQPIVGTAVQVTVPAELAGDIVEIEYQAALGDTVNLAANLYLRVAFSRKMCGIVLGAPALLGYSADRFDYPGFPCAAHLGGFPAAPHASFHAEIYTRGDCEDAFAGYKNTNHAGNMLAAGSGAYLADDIGLAVSACNMVGYEIAHKGNGIVQVDLRTSLSNSDPENGGLIPGTRTLCMSIGNDVQLCRTAFDPPIPLPQNLWAVFRASTSTAGPVLTCKQADPGNTENLYMAYDDGAWNSEAAGGACWSGFELTIFCDASPTPGACCDMVLTDEVGEAVCRDGVAQMNCAFPELWEEGAMCGSICENGANDGDPCMRQADCPGGWCPGPFPHPCGVSACCDPDGSCNNLTENECDAIPPVEDPRMYQPAEFCYEQGQRCPFPACLQREGECTQPRSAWCVGGENDGLLCDFWAYPSDCLGYSCVGGTHDGEICDPDDVDPCPGGGECTRASCVGEVGCEDPYCCTDVCTDPYNVFCCTTYWDVQCATEAFRLCDRAPSNDECYDPISDVKGAQLINVPGTVEGDGIQATTNPSDPGFCCHEDGLGAQGVGTVWFKFLATGTTVSLDTCCSYPRPYAPADDSLLQVFAIAEPDRGLCGDGLTVCSVSGQDCPDGSACILDEQWACSHLMPIACSDNAGSSCVCGPYESPANSRTCVTGLVPGDTYYVLVGAKTEENIGIWQLRIASPCSQVRPPLHNDLCMNAEQPTGGQVVVPFDISGAAFGEGAATLDCPEPPATCLTTMKNDVWFDWTAPIDGQTTIHTCGDDDASTPNTSMVVYDGCTCPVEIGTELGCSNFQPSPCFLGSKVAFDAVEGHCYKIRLGGHLGDTPAGNLTITIEGGIPDCNGNGIPDDEDIASGTSPDCDGDGVPDECEHDSDGDGTIDDCDGCPYDPNKTEPGVCGCGIPDYDSDGDGVEDCNDGCPQDPDKTEPGVCGCGVPDDDSDGDGVEDCIDGCPHDPDKVEPGVCGCGVPDDDSDGDGVEDCIDGCPLDPDKIEPGVCGCGVPDDDSDGDGVEDCIDGCPHDPDKIEPGVCGCGVPDDDSDGDGLEDCNDGCPLDPTKIQPGVCGCGIPDDDSDGDGIEDCIDGCPHDPYKTEPGVCGCGIPDDDSDGDTVPDCADQCPGEDDLLDEDQDGTPDCLDPGPIPTLSHWGLLALALLLLSIGKARFGKRGRLQA